MIQIKNILAPTDCSEISKDAMFYAMEMAKMFNAQLTVFNVIAPAGEIDELSDPSNVYQEMLNELREQKKKEFENFWDSIALVGIKATLVQEEGEPFTEIIQYAQKTSQDLIVMGTHGRTGLLHIMMGSVAEKVVRYSAIPVLTVKHKDFEHTPI